MRPLIRIAAAAALGWLAVAAGAQDVVTGLPAAPVAQRGSNARIMDWKFITLSLAGKGAMTADLYFTRLDLDAGYREHNPLLGQRPGTPRLVATGMAWDAGLDVLGYQLRRRGSRWWWTLRIAQVAINTKFAISNSQASRR